MNSEYRETLSTFSTVYDNPSQAALHYYLAGIVDGEGCIRIDKTFPEKGRSIYRAVLQIGMTDKNVVLLAKSVFGGSFREERVPGRQVVYRLKVQSKKDWEKVFAVLDGKLLVKQDQLEAAKRFFGEKLSNPNHKRVLTDVELLRREGLYLESKELNAVGAGATTERVHSREAEATV